jgi:hypothetical protein
MNGLEPSPMLEVLLLDDDLFAMRQLLDYTLFSKYL